jgi:uncharacterized membrane protein (UPF0127 family)
MVRAYRVFGAGAFMLLSGLASAGRVSAEAGLEKLEIKTATGPEKGLMFRRFLPKDRGMLFDFKVEKPVEMWMKNTYISLDMVFISHSGRVVGIARNAEPLSETIIPSGAAAAGVLEVNAGEADAIGLKVGDEVRHPLFKN